VSEFNYSETTFVPPPEAGHACRVRIFTHANNLVVEDGELVAGRYAFGGATVAREKLTSAVKVFAVMPKTFDGEGAVCRPPDAVCSRAAAGAVGLSSPRTTTLSK